MLGKDKAGVTDLDFTDQKITDIDQISYKTLSKFQNLKTLNLRNNEIAHLPENLSQLKNL